jgi:hypothetical protein
MGRGKCKDCGKPLGKNSKATGAVRCKSCAQKGKNNSRYIDGRTLKINRCVDCGKRIQWHATRCETCNGEWAFVKGKYAKVLNKEMLMQEYVRKGRSIHSIGKEFGRAEASIYRALLRYKILIRSKKESATIFWSSIEGITLRQKYSDETKGIDRRKHISHGKDCGSYIDGRVAKGSKCLFCGITLKDYRYKFCPLHKYLGRNIRGDRNGNWHGGISFVPYPLGWTKTHKEQIRYRDGYKCRLCGVPEVEAGEKLSVHHVDYIKKHIDEKNLVSLCRVCHGKMAHNRKFWKKFWQERVEEDTNGKRVRQFMGRKI